MEVDVRDDGEEGREESEREEDGICGLRGEAKPTRGEGG